MIATYRKYEVLVVGFPFSSQIKEKARPVVVISSEKFNKSKRHDLIVLAITSSSINKLDFELEIEQWQSAGLLKPSILKAAIATVDQENVIQKLGVLLEIDSQKIDSLVSVILNEDDS